MDAYEVYLSTLRYVMNADPEDRSSWSDIFKYLPCLHQMLLCSVCGNLLNHPQGPVNSICLHHVCHGCVGGKMRLKPSCSWCKDHSLFTENKKLRILVLCFKRLCAYISHSKLGAEILKGPSNGPGKDPELTRQALRDAEEFSDDFPFASPHIDTLKFLKPSSSQGLIKFPSSLPYSKPSTSGVTKEYSSRSGPSLKNNSNSRSSNQNSTRGRRRKNLSKIPLKSPNKTNTSIHIKRLKRKALSARNRPPNASTKKFHLKKLPSPGHRFVKRNSPPDSSGLLIAQRPHRELSGKFSIGQLWRETFLEERPPEPEAYPDSGIEVGNASDQDHGSQPPTLKHQSESEKSSSKIETTAEKMTPHLRDTRLHPAPGPKVVTNSGDAESVPMDIHHKPRLTLTISKRQLSKGSRKGQPKGPVLREPSDSSTNNFANRVGNRLPHLTRKGLKSSVARSLSRRRDICRCARFKQPNQLTCFGQKCPCYRDRKACIDCLCNGCKNPRRKSDSAPSLMHMVSESNCIQHGIDPSMPRLSPIPRM